MSPCLMYQLMLLSPCNRHYNCKWHSARRQCNLFECESRLCARFKTLGRRKALALRSGSRCLLYSVRRHIVLVAHAADIVTCLAGISEANCQNTPACYCMWTKADGRCFRHPRSNHSLRITVQLCEERSC